MTSQEAGTKIELAFNFRIWALDFFTTVKGGFGCMLV